MIKASVAFRSAKVAQQTFFRGAKGYNDQHQNSRVGIVFLALFLNKFRPHKNL